ncbi:MAG TPA: type II toxin-antitoxin system Phd/YefM family antitoxin, partial [Candidatus Sulfotelmatobacter sp.]|nr:type II toxin-antitoxin system Phd/YefM family antitoxin [Candidatus Sulfotelmatobacter sp.]
MLCTSANPRSRHSSDAISSEVWLGAPADHYQKTCIISNNVATLLHMKRAAAMTITTLSSREFNQDTSRAKQATRKGPVYITDRGRPAHVLLTIEEYQR